VRILYTGGPFVPAYTITSALNTAAGVAATLRGSIYVADTGSGAIRLLTPIPGTTGLFNISDVGSERYQSPEGIAVDAAGNVFVGERGAVRRIAPGGAVTTLASGFLRPAALAADALGNVYVADRSDGALWKVAPSGLATRWAQLGDPAGIAIAADGSVYVADAAAHAVRRIEVVRTETPPRRRAARH
jgi:streptogramin lyase